MSIIHTSKVLYNCCGASCSNCQALNPTMMMKSCCRLGNSRRMPFVLACTSPPGLTTSRGCLRSLLVHWRSHLAVGSGSVWTHMRTAPGTPGSETPWLPHRSATTSSQWWGCLAHLLLGTWCWRWRIYHRQMSSPWVVRGAWAQMNLKTVIETSRECFTQTQSTHELLPLPPRLTWWWWCVKTTIFLSSLASLVPWLLYIWQWGWHSPYRHLDTWYIDTLHNETRTNIIN